MADWLTPDSAVGTIVTHEPKAATVFRRRRIDFCCNGAQLLRDACREASLDPADLLREIAEASSAPSTSDTRERDWREATLTELCTHVIARHHAYLRPKLRRLTQYLAKISDVHGENHPELADVRATFAALYEELLDHMATEEQVLFPAITQIEAASELRQSPPDIGDSGIEETIEQLIRQLEDEHRRASDTLEKLHDLTLAYALPADACATFRETYESLDRLEVDTFWHIHLETNILHPRAIELAGSV